MQVQLVGVAQYIGMSGIFRGKRMKCYEDRIGINIESNEIKWCQDGGKDIKRICGRMERGRARSKGRTTCGLLTGI